MDVDLLHQGLLGQQHGLLRRATDADAEHARRAPAGAHQGDGLDHPVDQAVAGVEDGELGLVLGATALGRQLDVDPVARHQADVDHRRGIVASVAALAVGWGHHGGAQPIVRMVVGPTHALVDHRLEAQGGIRPTHLHADLEEGDDHPRVLADGAMALGAETRVIKDLGHGIARGGRFLALIGLAQGTDVIQRMVIGDELQGIGDAGDEVFLANRGHGWLGLGWDAKGKRL